MTRTDPRVTALLKWMEGRGTKKNREGMARFGIVSPKAFGISVTDLRARAKAEGRDHELALQLWDTGWYEARMLAALVDEPAKITATQMNRWAKDFDNWAVCDNACFHLFDKSPLALQKVKQWSTRKEELVKRASFALLASIALHDKRAPDATFTATFPLIEVGAEDDRNFVKKGVSWALRGIGHRNPVLRVAAMDVAERLTTAESSAARWVGRDTIRDLKRG